MGDRLLSLLRERSFQRKRVLLASGQESDFFIDVKQTALLAEGHLLLGDRLLSAVRSIGGSPVAVAGVALGGCSLASAVAYASAKDATPLDAIYVRKEVKDHGSKRRLEGDSHLAPGSAVVVLEDVVTTGGSTLVAIGQLVEAGYRVPAVVAVIDRLEGGAQRIRESGHLFVSLFDRTHFMGEGA